MKIDFTKISKESKSFEYQKENILFIGSYKKDRAILYKLIGKISGKLDSLCDKCGVEYQEDIDEDIELYLSDGVYNSNEDEFLDVIEQYNGYVDIDEVLIGEIESIKSDYHLCVNCKKS